MFSQDRNAIIMAAGQGTRLRPLTETQPKPLVPVNGVPILEYTLQALELGGITDVSIVTGYKSEKIHNYIAARDNSATIRIVNNDDYLTTNNIWSLHLVSDQIRNGTTIIDGDVLVSPSIIAEFNRVPDSSSFLIGVDRTHRERGAYAKIAGQYIVGIEIADSPENEEPGTLLKTTSIYRVHSYAAADALRNRIRHFINNDRLSAFYEQAIDDVLRTGLTGHAVECSSHLWWEIDTPDDLENATRLVLQSQTASDTAHQAGAEQHNSGDER